MVCWAELAPSSLSCTFARWQLRTGATPAQGKRTPIERTQRTQRILDSEGSLLHSVVQLFAKAFPRTDVIAQVFWAIPVMRLSEEERKIEARKDEQLHPKSNSHRARGWGKDISMKEKEEGSGKATDWPEWLHGKRGFVLNFLRFFVLGRWLLVVCETP